MGGYDLLERCDRRGNCGGYRKDTGGARRQPDTGGGQVDAKSLGRTRPLRGAEINGSYPSGWKSVLRLLVLMRIASMSLRPSKSPTDSVLSQRPSVIRVRVML